MQIKIGGDFKSLDFKYKQNLKDDAKKYIDLLKNDKINDFIENICSVDGQLRLIDYPLYVIKVFIIADVIYADEINDMLLFFMKTMLYMVKDSTSIDEDTFSQLLVQTFVEQVFLIAYQLEISYDKNYIVDYIQHHNNNFFIKEKDLAQLVRRMKLNQSI